MVSLREELPPEGDADEARQVLDQVPLRLPTYKLERVHVAVLNVDYSPPHGSGYARPLSQYRLQQLRQEWEPLAVSPLVISRRHDNSLWVIDGNHRRYISYEKGQLQLPAMVHSGLERAEEARLYTLLGTVLGQTPYTRFQAKLVSGDEAAIEINRIAQRFGFEINGTYGKAEGRIQAVARVEWIYARGGPDALMWVFGLLNDAFGGDRDSLSTEQLEGVYGFWARYSELVKRDEVAQVLGASGLYAWINRANSIYDRVDVGARGNTYGLAIAEMVNDVWRRKGAKVKGLLPAWEAPAQLGQRTRMRDRGNVTNWTTTSARGNLTPQQLV